MKLEMLGNVLLTKMSARKEGDVFLMPADTELTLIAGLSGETLTIPRVTRVEAIESLLIADTIKGERFAVGVDDVRALKIDRAVDGRKERSAGFGK